MLIADNLPLSNAEMRCVARRSRGGLLHRVMGAVCGASAASTQSLRASEVELLAKSIIVPAGFSETEPIYILVGDNWREDGMLFLRGQWLYDPHTFAVTQDMFERWEPSLRFFMGIRVRYVTATRWVLRCDVLDNRFLECEKVDCQKVPVLSGEVGLLSSREFVPPSK